MIIKTFLTPHGSRCATTVAIVRPLSPKGRAEDRKLDEYFRKVKGRKACGERVRVRGFL